MTLWFVFALMTVAAIFAVLLPLGRSGRAQNQGSEVAVYKDQLAEIERDLAAGLIAAPEADAARVEVSRRLLAAAGSEPATAPKSSLKWRRAAAVLALAGLPLVAIGVYVPLGSPRLQDFPLAQRERGSGSGMAQSLENLVVQVEQHLEKNPTDGRGWNVIAPVLERLGRFDDAVRAYRNSLAYNGESAERRSDLGEAISAAAGGVVTAEAKTEFERARALSADDP
jgi:cytochrome c-type biogenesis protein CcmH